MGLGNEFVEGQTPLDDDEVDGLLIGTISNREELDEFEQQNIQSAVEWAIGKKLRPEKVFTEEFVRELHYKMFGQVWRWAGQFRKTNKNIGCDWHKIGTLLRQLNDDANFWVEKKTYSEEEIAIRYKHEIVRIHCFAMEMDGIPASWGIS